MQIIPTVFEKDLAAAQNRIFKIGNTSQFVQIDISDNVFTPGKSFELELLNKIESASKLWHIHLMVKEPLKWINKSLFVHASRIIGQVEMMSNRSKFIYQAQDSGLEAGLAFDIDTPVDNIPPTTDMLLLMGRRAGFPRTNLDPQVLTKIKQAQDLGFPLALDGGVDPSNFSQILQLGIDVLYSGQYYFYLINAKSH